MLNEIQTAKRASYIPSNSTKITDNNSDAVAYIYTAKNGKPAARVFFGKQSKPVSAYQFKDAARRESHIIDKFESRKLTLDWKKELRNDRNKPHTLKTGDILYTSWGYDQTNVEFFQVVNVPSKCMVEVREIAQSRTEEGFMAGRTAPIKDEFKGDVIRRKSNNTNSIRIHSSATASPYEGTPKYWSSYA